MYILTYVCTLNAFDKNNYWQFGKQENLLAHPTFTYLVI